MNPSGIFLRDFIKKDFTFLPVMIQFLEKGLYSTAPAKGPDQMEQ